MNIYKYLLISILIINCLLTTSYSLAQNEVKIDSLLNQLKTAKADTNKVNILNSLAWKLRNNKPDKSFKYATLALSLSKRLKFKKGTATSYQHIGIFNKNKGNYRQALIYYFKFLKIVKEIGDKKAIAACFGNIGEVYMDLGNYVKAIQYHMKSLKVQEELENKIGVADCFNNIGIVYYYQGNYEKVIEYFLESLKIREELGDKKGIAGSLNNIGIFYKNQNKYEKAIEYYMKSLKISKELGDKLAIADNLNNIGVVYYMQRNDEKAIDYYLQSLKIKEELGDKEGIAESFANIGEFYKENSKLEKAVEYTIKSLNIHIAVETCGFFEYEINIRSIMLIDTFLYDLKLINRDKHILHTGRDNRLIIENLFKLISDNKEIIVRIPLIRSANDTDEDINDFLNLLKKIRGNIKEVNILPYHKFGIQKYKYLGRDKIPGFDTFQDKKLENILIRFKNNGINTKIVN